MNKRILLGILILLTGYAYGQKSKPKKGPESSKMEDKVIVPPPVKVTSVEGITEYRLQNGLRVLLFPDQSKQTITVNITYMVGSKHENYGETGMAPRIQGYTQTSEYSAGTHRTWCPAKRNHVG